ncbi:MAG: NAD(+) synthase [Bacteroidales bacterium]|nr:NAD(+) synthase [Bacteroidales bacterium]MBR0499537.1 NAD(+) synthase [Bacteroidales bacterium]
MILEPNLDIAAVHDLLVGKIRNYFASAGKTRAVLGLSGGIDSAIVAALAVDALGAENVHGILMPSEFSSLSSVTDSIELSNNLGISYDIVPIEKIYKRSMIEMIRFFELGKWSVAQENIQARIRGMILMTWSNRFDALLLNTSNKSELFTGYGTLYGDLCGAVMVIADLYKLQVYELSRYENALHGSEVIPEAILTKAPSAELRPNQKDSDSLPEYEQLDPVLHALCEEGLSPEEVVAKGTDAALVERIVKLKRGSAFKVMQIPPVLTVGDHPIVPEFKRI